MLRRIVFVFAIAMSVQIICSDPTLSKNRKAISEADEDLMLDLDVLAYSNLRKREVGSIFKEVIEEVLTDVYSLMKTIFDQFKMNLLKKFESHTMANVLLEIINGLPDPTTVNSDPELSADEVEVVEPMHVVPEQSDTYNYRNP